MLSHVDREEVSRVVALEMRSNALVAEPAGLRPPPPFDLEAERAVLCAMFEGVRAPNTLMASDFLSEFNRCAFIILDEMLKMGMAPTVAAVGRAFGKCGVMVRDVEEGVRNLAEGPICVPLEKEVARVVSLANRRRALVRLDFLRAVLTEPNATEAQVEAAERDYRAAREGTR